LSPSTVAITADITFRNIVAASENSISDSSQVDLNIFRSDVGQQDLEAANSRVNHHLHVMFSGQRGFNFEALALADVLTGRSENLPGRSDRRGSWILGRSALLIASGSSRGIL
jgi:hypothetical protein